MEDNYDNYEKTLADNQFIGGYVHHHQNLSCMLISNLYFYE